MIYLASFRYMVLFRNEYKVMTEFATFPWMFCSGSSSDSEVRCREVNPTEQVTAKISKMQATIGCLSRIVSRTLVNNVVNGKEASSSGNVHHPIRASTSSTSTQPFSTATAENCDPIPEHARLLTAVSGFPKSQASYNIDHILKVNRFLF